MPKQVAQRPRAPREVAKFLEATPPGALCGKRFSQVYPTGESYGLRSAPPAADRKWNRTSKYVVKCSGIRDSLEDGALLSFPTGGVTIRQWGGSPEDGISEEGGVSDA